MKNFFSLENPLIQFLSRACDLMIINLLFIVSCIPVFTIGAAICGMTKVCQAIVTGDERGTWQLYVTALKTALSRLLLFGCVFCSLPSACSATG